MMKAREKGLLSRLCSRTKLPWRTVRVLTPEACLALCQRPCEVPRAESVQALRQQLVELFYTEQGQNGREKLSLISLSTPFAGLWSSRLVLVGQHARSLHARHTHTPAKSASSG